MKRFYCSLAIVLMAMFSLGGVASVFWYQDWQYRLPTPRPSFLPEIPVGTAVGLPVVSARASLEGEEKPALLHFFSPDCPCSRFNLDHVRALTLRYRGRVRFLAVLRGEPTPALQAAFRDCRLEMEPVYDRTGAIAARYGVYSTPQAVVLDGNRHLYYRGNYNLSRYCLDPATEFAHCALEELLAARQRPVFPAAATRAYGCPIAFDRAALP